MTQSSVILQDGASTGQLPITILPDNIPELAEAFIITLNNVELVGNTAGVIAQNIPKLGVLKQAYGFIAKNDDANGKFRIYSNNPRAIENGQAIEVEEIGNLAVELVVERLGKQSFILFI